VSSAPAEVKRPARKRSGTAKWHMSREAVDLPLADLYRLDDAQCWEFFVEARFGSKSTVRCPYCGSIGKHYRRLHDKRWKCHCCDKTFTVTTGTIFDRHRLSLKGVVIGALTWITVRNWWDPMARTITSPKNTTFATTEPRRAFI
jgi:transposase-like protein